jgi:hypothetical protein
MLSWLPQIVDDDVDDPDLSLRLSEGLREHTGGEIKTVVASAADANIYRSAAAFEDIITDPNLLKVRIICAVESFWRVCAPVRCMCESTRACISTSSYRATWTGVTSVGMAEPHPSVQVRCFPGLSAPTAALC